MYKNILSLKEHAFKGFVPISTLCEDLEVVPNRKGVYVVLCNPEPTPAFLEKGVGGFFKQKNPNVAEDVLSQKWVNESCLLYIGQAGGNNSKATLRERIKQYIQFGFGKPVGHYGGRYIWQLAGSNELLLAWKETDEDPRILESDMITDFENQYGNLPFANLLR